MVRRLAWFEIAVVMALILLARTGAGGQDQLDTSINGKPMN